MPRPGPQERDICREFVMPAIEVCGWQPEQVVEQFPVAAQRVVALGGVTRELGSGFVDYVLEATLPSDGRGGGQTSVPVRL